MKLGLRCKCFSRNINQIGLIVVLLLMQFLKGHSHQTVSPVDLRPAQSAVCKLSPGACGAALVDFALVSIHRNSKVTLCFQN